MLATAATALLALAPVAHAGNPSWVRLTVPGDRGGAHTGTWQGDSLAGNPDPAGPPAPFCTPGQCDRIELAIEASDTHYTAHHVLSVALSISYDDRAGRTFDIALLTGSFHLIKSLRGVAPGQQLVVSGMQIDQYYVEVDSDNALTPTPYVGRATLLASTPSGASTATYPAVLPPPPLSAPSAQAVQLPAVNTGSSRLVGAGVKVPNAHLNGAPSRFGTAPIVAPTNHEAAQSSVGKRLWLYAAGAVALAWFVRRFRRAWRDAAIPKGAR